MNANLKSLDQEFSLTVTVALPGSGTLGGQVYIPYAGAFVSVVRADTTFKFSFDKRETFLDARAGMKFAVGHGESFLGLTLKNPNTFAINVILSIGSLNVEVRQPQAAALSPNDVILSSYTLAANANHAKAAPIVPDPRTQKVVILAGVEDIYVRVVPLAGDGGAGMGAAYDDVIPNGTSKEYFWAGLIYVTPVNTANAINTLGIKQYLYQFL